MKKFSLALSFITLFSLLSACDTPQTPVGRPTPVPSDSSVEEDPICQQTLQCIVDTTGNNALRKQAQEVITQLFLLSEPNKTRICESKAEELVESLPTCDKSQAAED